MFIGMTFLSFFANGGICARINTPASPLLLRLCRLRPLVRCLLLLRWHGLMCRIMTCVIFACRIISLAFIVALLQFWMVWLRLNLNWLMMCLNIRVFTLMASRTSWLLVLLLLIRLLTVVRKFFVVRRLMARLTYRLGSGLRLRLLVS